MRATSWPQVRGELWQTKGNTVIETSLRLLVSSSWKLIANCFLLLMPELWSTYGPQTPSDMWSLPQDVTMATDPLGLEEWFFTLRRWSGRGGSAVVRWEGVEAVIESASLTSCMALQGYGDDLAGRMYEVNLVDLFLHTDPQETPPTITSSRRTFIISIYRHAKSV